MTDTSQYNHSDEHGFTPKNTNMTKRPFADVAIAFANGAAIQYRPLTLIGNCNREWLDWPHSWFPSFRPTDEGSYGYRIKPQKAWRWVYARKSVHSEWHVSDYHYASKEHFERMCCGCIAIEPVLSTEKEM